MEQTQSKSVDVLNSFLRGEISAVETYRQALDKITGGPVRTNLQECLRSHEERVNLLSQRIRSIGGEPAEGSGAWGAFAKLVEGGAKAFGEKAAISALEEGEDHGRNDYQRDVDKLDLDSRQLVEHQVLPEQLRTHRVLSDMKKALH